MEFRLPDRMPLSLCATVAAAAVTVLMSGTAAPAGSWWGGQQSCVYVHDPDYLPRNWVRRPYYISDDVVMTGDTVCRIERIGGEPEAGDGNSGLYRAECRLGDGEAQPGHTIAMQEEGGQLTMVWKSTAAQDTYSSKIGPLQRCWPGTPTE